MDALKIISPPPRRTGALAQCLIIAASLLMTTQHNAGKASATPLMGWIVATAMLVGCLCTIDRNLFFRNRSRWRAPGNDTTAGRILLGIGLSERQAADVIGKLEAFCGRRLAGGDAALPG